MASCTVENGIRKIHALEDPTEYKDAIPVTAHFSFLRIGEIDTQKEKFEAHIVVEARWIHQPKNDDDDEPDEKEKDLLSSLSKKDLKNFHQGKIVKLSDDYSEKYWYPQLFILNIARDSDEEIKYSIIKSESDIQVREYHDIHGEFYSEFDLHHFPDDIQELPVSLGSALFDNEIRLQIDPSRPAGINREAFVAQQEWRLYDHVDTRTRFLKGFLFQNDDYDEVDRPGHDRKRSVLTISCHAARRSSYFFWNGYCLIFLITLSAFGSFAIPPNTTQNRISITCTLLLTSIAFRWTISNSLPNISYLTFIDRYANRFDHCSRYSRCVACGHRNHHLHT